MEKEIKLIEKEMEEINKFDSSASLEDVVSFSTYCGGFLTVICC